MPIAKEFTIRQEDKPGTIGKLCRALADQNVDILGVSIVPF
jgi:predicted amino acid-binding ACT domain protein